MVKDHILQNKAAEVLPLQLEIPDQEAGELLVLLPCPAGKGRKIINRLWKFCVYRFRLCHGGCLLQKGRRRILSSHGGLVSFCAASRGFAQDMLS